MKKKLTVYLYLHVKIKRNAVDGVIPITQQKQ